MVKTSAWVLVNLLTLSALAQAEELVEAGNTVVPVNQPEQVSAEHVVEPIVIPATTVAGMYAQENYIGISDQAARSAIKAFTPQEWQYIAKAARNIGQYEQAQTYYQALSTTKTRASQQDGRLGLWLTAIDQRAQDSALTQGHAYLKQFGNDASAQDAQQYYRQVFKRDFNNASVVSDNERIKADYRAAAKQKRFAKQRELLQQYPQLFGGNDALWLDLAEQQEIIATTQTTTADNTQNLNTANERLLALLAAHPDNVELQKSGLASQLDAAVRLNRPQDGIAAYQQLQTLEPNIAVETKAMYADALLSNKQPKAALAVLASIPTEQLTDEMHDNIISAYSDMGYMSKAQASRQNWSIAPKRNDFTHNYRIPNAYATEREFWDIRLNDWDGHHRKANRMVKARLDVAPADTNALRLKGDLRRWQGFPDDALAAYDEAAYYIHPDERVGLQVNRATVFLDQGDYRSAHASIDLLPDYSASKQDLLKRLDLQAAPQLNVQSSWSDTTSPPQQQHEWSINSQLFSARSQDGHRAYVEHEVETSPYGKDTLRMQRVGVGAELNFYPTQVDIAAGHGTELNQKPYLHASVNHQFNQWFKAGLEVQKNSETTPLRALEKDVYADAAIANANFHLSADVDAGLGVSVNDLDDGNLRREAYAYVSSTLWQRDRFSLKNYSRIDWQKNRPTASAAYYNPEQAHSFSTEFTAQYRHFLDHDVQFTQQLTAGIGRYYQKNQAAEDTWLLRYGHNWDIHDAYGIGYSVGRKRSIYDGNPEYSNFIGLNASIKF
ncbi:poly-beta-1,6 N-acetyl-D-glucosamine export porin PgaA [Vitreoscilla massiliensis]|uniref:Poly-beta-1,6 N-acetyl-D-glucosamine export porin PgaA n=1 Tax=Vitreoscilla massiliensis TaxID=1689272 RepID=A0ABY4DZJ9_9NEIS|nr:poly-beta-1,6 N-acetyl-D-glucosamine export porin PgaA [Vitreoscilla massiliensis]UOO88957.1 poly-beta-1,6 N-acetyl-D-glucosamine export porin PgaA [Vitreoscilla massiliensis]